jgi:hypothetical protein
MSTTTWGDRIASVIPGLVISLATSLVVFASTFSNVNAKVDANSEAIKSFVPRTEHEQVYKWQEKYESEMNSRLDRLENKVDKLTDIVVQQSTKGK